MFFLLFFFASLASISHPPNHQTVVHVSLGLASTREFREELNAGSKDPAPKTLLMIFDSVAVVVRYPFREEHLAVCRKFFLYTCHFGEDVPSHHIPLPPVGGYWWLLVLAWDKKPAQMVHQCTKVYGIWARMSRHVMSPLSQQLLKVQT